MNRLDLAECNSGLFISLAADAYDRLAPECDNARGRLFQTGKCIDKLRLAVTLNSGDTDDLASAHRERDILDGVVFMQLARHGEVLDFQHRCARRRSGF